MNERLKKFVEYLAFSNIEFAESIGVSRQQYEGWVNQNIKVPVHCLIKIAQIYKEINTRWLLTGEESMLVGELNSYRVNQAEVHFTKAHEKNISSTSISKNSEFENCEQLKNELLMIKGKYIELLEKVISEKGILEFDEKHRSIRKIDGFELEEKSQS